MKVKDGIQALQNNILVKIKALLSDRDDYDIISKELAKDYSNSKTLNDFIINCMLKYKIQFKDLPFECQNNINFLVKLCKKDIRFLNELNGCFLFYKLIERLNLTKEDLKLLNLNTRKEIQRLHKLMSEKLKTESPNL